MDERNLPHDLRHRLIVAAEERRDFYGNLIEWMRRQKWSTTSRAYCAAFRAWAEAGALLEAVKDPHGPKPKQVRYGPDEPAATLPDVPQLKSTRSF